MSICVFKLSCFLSGGYFPKLPVGQCAGGGHFTLGFRAFTQVNAQYLFHFLRLCRSAGFHHLEALVIAPAGDGEGLDACPTRL